MEEKKKIPTKVIVKWSLIALVIVLLILSIFAQKIFGADSKFAEVIQLNMGDIANVFGLIGDNIPKILKALTYIVVIQLVSRGIRYLLKLTLKRSIKGQTVLNLLDSFVKYFAAFASIWLVLISFGVDTTTLLASAGILALVIGLGAQSLISDILSGLFIVFENEFEVGDIVVIDNFRGTVAEIGVRTTHILDVAGNIKIINNSDIRNIVNMSKTLSLAICDVEIEYGESIERVEAVFKDQLPLIKDKVSTIVEGPYYKGVSAFNPSGVQIKIIAQCLEENKFQTERDLYRQIKLLFDRNNIGVPFPQVVVNQPKTFGKVTKVEKKEAEKFVEEQKEISKNIDTQDK